MLFTSTKMDRPGTILMHVLGIPTYVGLLVLALVFPYGKPLLGFALCALGALAYQFAYSKFLYFFTNRLQPQRAIWQFFAGVLAVQAIALWAAYAAA